LSALPANSANGLEAGDQYRANAALQYRLATPTLKNTLTHYKIWLFTPGSGVMMGASGWSLFHLNRTCPTDPEKAKACAQAHRWNTRIFSLSAGIWLLGFAAAYLALPLLTVYDRLAG
jgi:hypothetical protein